MIRTLLAIVGVLAIIFAGWRLAVERPWEKASPQVVPADATAAPAIHFETLRADGINVERIHIDAKAPKAVLYVSFAEFFKAPVLLRAFDRTGKELGRSRRVLSGEREDAVYADFDFDARVPLGSATFLTLTKSQVEAPDNDVPVPVRIAEEKAPEAAPVPEVAPQNIPAPEAATEPQPQPVPAPEAVPAEVPAEAPAEAPANVPAAA